MKIGGYYKKKSADEPDDKAVLVHKTEPQGTKVEAKAKTKSTASADEKKNNNKK